MRRAGGAHSATGSCNHLPAHPTSPHRYQKEPLEAALLDSLAGQDVGELSVGVRDEEAGGHVFLDELGDTLLGAGADRRVGQRAVQLAWLCGRGAALVSPFTTVLPPCPPYTPALGGDPPASTAGCWCLPSLGTVLCTADDAGSLGVQTMGWTEPEPGGKYHHRGSNPRRRHGKARLSNATSYTLVPPHSTLRVA